MRFLVLGEIIFDEYPDRATLGGAPLNFAAYAAAAGAECHLLSAVGEDENGTSAIRAAAGYGIGTEGIARIPGMATGTCRVTLSATGVPRYEILENVAYDAITAGAFAGEDFDLFYFGTLIQRAPAPCRAIREILAAGRCREVFCDVNLRAPFVSRNAVLLCLQNATMLKISDEELPKVLRLSLGSEENAPADAAQALAAAFPQLHTVVITCGAAGALVWDTRERRLFRAPAKPVQVVSTVGAGDAFAAAFATAYLRGAGAEAALQAGIAQSARTVAAAGAIVL